MHREARHSEVGVQDLELERESRRIRRKQEFLRRMGQPDQGGLLASLKKHTEDGEAIPLGKELYQLGELFVESSVESFEEETSKKSADEARKIWKSATALYGSEWRQLLQDKPGQPSEPMKQQAKEWHADSERFHAAYVGGEIWRHVPSLKKMGCTQDEVTDRVLEWWQETKTDASDVSAALPELIQKLEARHDTSSGRHMIKTLLWSSTLRSEMKQFFNADRSFLLYRLSEKPTDVLINRGGLHAALATIAFAVREGWASESTAVEKLTELMNRSPEQLKQLLTQPQGEKEKKERTILLCALQSANLMWIGRRPYQSVAEHMAGQSGKKGFGRVEHANNPYIMPFDSMAKEKGWDAVLLDRDQIVAGLRLLKEKQHEEATARTS